jgi:hypothetical protein
MEQLCSIGISAALGGVCIVMYQQSLGKAQSESMLGRLLDANFHWPVLAAGIVLVLTAVVRGVGLWSEVGRRTTAPVPAHGPDCCHGHAHSDEPEPILSIQTKPAPAHLHGPDCNHGHEHGTECDHDHDHHHEHEHDHQHHHSLPDDHGHDHGWNPWRYAILLIPLTLFFLNLPSEVFGVDGIEHNLARWDLANNDFDENLKTTGEVNLGFKELEQAAYLPARQAELKGKTGVLKGQFMPGSTPTTCRLVRLKMTCCAADAIPLDVRIISKEPFTDLQAGQWVEVKGVIDFRSVKGADEVKPVLQLLSITKIPPETNPYLP